MSELGANPFQVKAKLLEPLPPPIVPSPPHSDKTFERQVTQEDIGIVRLLKGVTITKADNNVADTFPQNFSTKDIIGMEHYMTELVKAGNLKSLDVMFSTGNFQIDRLAHYLFYRRVVDIGKQRNEDASKTDKLITNYDMLKAARYVNDTLTTLSQAGKIRPVDANMAVLLNNGQEQTVVTTGENRVYSIRPDRTVMQISVDKSTLWDRMLQQKASPVENDAQSPQNLPSMKLGEAKMDDATFNRHLSVITHTATPGEQIVICPKTVWQSLLHKIAGTASIEYIRKGFFEDMGLSGRYNPNSVVSKWTGKVMEFALKQKFPTTKPPSSQEILDYLSKELPNNPGVSQPITIIQGENRLGSK